MSKISATYPNSCVNHCNDKGISKKNTKTKKMKAFWKPNFAGGHGTTTRCIWKYISLYILWITLQIMGFKTFSLLTIFVSCLISLLLIFQGFSKEIPNLLYSINYGVTEPCWSCCVPEHQFSPHETGADQLHVGTAGSRCPTIFIMDNNRTTKN